MHEENQTVTQTGSDAATLHDNQRWYAVHTQPHRESLAAAQLAQQGFRAFLPRLAKTVRHARRTRTVLAPVFSRYLFVALDIDRDRWRSVNGTSGVSRLVMVADRPAPAPIGVIETLIRSTDENGRLRFDDGLAVGQTVRLVAGPFADSLGVLARLSGAGRVELLMRILNGEILVNISRDWVAPVLRT